MKVLVTGAAGFIGMHVAQRLLQRGDAVLGVDDLNDYYDPRLKRARLDQLAPSAGFDFVRMDIADAAAVDSLFRKKQIERVVHLAAQAGVRYAMHHPQAYVHSNLQGFANIIEACARHRVQHLVYASSSSVYGGNTKLPFAETDPVDHPLSLYAATKKSNELVAHAYSHQHGLPTTGLRFFTVYGPWGRPDMAYFRFADAITQGRPIEVYVQSVQGHDGRMQRDFTYIDDVVNGVLRVLDKAPPATAGQPPWRVFNIGREEPVALDQFINVLERHLGQAARRVNKPMPPGDVPATWADVSALQAWVGFRPTVSLDAGLERFVRWYRQSWAPRFSQQSVAA